MVQSVPLANFYEIKPQTLHFPPSVPEENSPEKKNVLFQNTLTTLPRVFLTVSSLKEFL